VNLFYFLVQMLFCPCNNPVTPLLCAVVFLFPSASFCPVQIWLIAKPEISKSFVTTEILLSHSKNIPLPKAQAGSHCCRLSPTARPGTRRIQSHTASVKCLSQGERHFTEAVKCLSLWLSTVPADLGCLAASEVRRSSRVSFEALAVTNKPQDWRVLSWQRLREELLSLECSAPLSTQALCWVPWPRVARWNAKVLPAFHLRAQQPHFDLP